MGLSPARERVIADNQFGSAAPATWYVGLSTTEPSDDGTNLVEPVGGSYARVAVTNNATNWPAATTVAGVTTKANGAKVTFPNPTGNWGALRAYGIFTAASGGVPEFFNLLDSPITAQSGNTPVEFDVGQIVTEWGS